MITPSGLPKCDPFQSKMAKKVILDLFSMKKGIFTYLSSG
jgi:hypothetical protein